MQQSGYFVSLEGIDGVGKTTLAEITGSALAGDGLVYVPRKEPLATNPFVAGRMRSLANLIWESGDRNIDHKLLPPEYWLNLQAAWYTAYSSNVIEQVLARPAHVLTDGWIFKFYAKLLVSGYKGNYLNTVFRGVRRPDVVILLDMDVEAVWTRKQQFNYAELGMHYGYRKLGRESFLECQSCTLARLKSLGKRHGWRVVKVSAEEAPERNAETVGIAIKDELARLGSPFRYQKSRGTATIAMNSRPD